MFLGAFAVGDVRNDIDQPQSPAVPAARDHLPAAGKPPDRSIGFQDPVFDRKPVLPVRQFVKAFGKVTVIGMEREPEFVMLAAEVPAPVLERYPEQRHRFVGPDADAGFQIGFPVHQPAGLEGGAIPRLALSEFFGSSLQRLFGVKQITLGAVAGGSSVFGFL